MTKNLPTYLLIAQSIPSDNQQLAQLRPLLARKYQLDAYLLQQRLIGRGPNLIAEGSKERLAEIAALLTQQDIRCWIIEAQPPRFIPLRLRGVRTGNEQLSLITDERIVTLESEHRVMAILADLSGQAAAKNLKYLMAQHVYSGIRDARPLGDEELTKAILRGEPVLDLYRYNELGRIDAGVRVLPGRFDANGLGEDATCSAIGNLKILLERIRNQVQDIRLVLDFGLANLPGCRLKSAQDGLHWQRDNLAALTRFGWLMADLAPSETYSMVTGAAPLPLLEALYTELGMDLPVAPDATPSPTRLPPPPPADNYHRSTGPRLFLGIGIAAGIGLLTTTGTDLISIVFKFCARTAILPSLLCGACIWGFFHFLRLKQHIENTPTSKARSLAMGLVELQGRAVRKYALVSPVSQMPCVFYRLRKYCRDSKNNWRLEHSTDSGHVPFYLEDDTGKVTIDPRGASVSARQRQESYGDRSSSLFGSIGSSSDEKWVEEILPEGAQLCILGQAGESRRARVPLRDRVTKALQELKRNPAALQEYDRNGDGRICETEWAQARTSIEQQVLQQSLANDPIQPVQHTRVVIKRPRQRSIPFVIAETESELHLVRNYTLLTLPLFAGALAGFIWTLMTLKDYLQP